MKIYQLVYSPTGGTRKVAECLGEALAKELGAESVQDVDLMTALQEKLSLTAEDLCIAAVPAFGGRVPQDAVGKLRKLQGNGAGVVLAAVYGNRAIDDTLIELQDILQENGFSCVAALEAVAEHSLVRSFGAGRPDAEDIKELQDFAAQIAEQLKGASLSEVIAAGTGTLAVPGNRPYKEFQPSPMSPVVEESCIGCRRCVAECPVQAIVSEDISRTDPAKCFSCMHCVAVCPVQARHNAPEKLEALTERLRDRCSGRKPNILYLSPTIL